MHCNLIDNDWQRGSCLFTYDHKLIKIDAKEIGLQISRDNQIWDKITEEFKWLILKTVAGGMDDNDWQKNHKFKK